MLRNDFKIELLNVAKHYEGKLAVSCDALQVKRGEFLTLLGPSGSGKTTLLMIVAGFTQPDAGTVLLDGKDITNEPAEHRNLGMMFQGYALFPHMTVFENVAFPLRVRKLPADDVKKRVMAALAQVQLEALAQRLPRQLSGGQQQRVALARATVFDPELLLFDEPLSALDRKLRSEMQAEIKIAHNKLRKTFIYVTHDQDEALSLSDRIVILRDGRIVQVGSPTELYEAPATSFVASFLGQSNFLRGDTVSGPGETLGISAGGRTVLHRQPLSMAPLKPRYTLSLRPEKIRIGAAEPTRSDHNSIAGEIVSRSYLGSTVSYTVLTEELGLMIAVREAWGEPFEDAVGSKVWLEWNHSSTVLVDLND